jgi:hypothetical protein
MYSHPQMVVFQDGVGIDELLTIARCEQTFSGGDIAVGQVLLSDPNLYIPPSSFMYQDTEFYQGFVIGGGNLE